MFDKLIEEIMKELPDFGRNLAIDSKKIKTNARGKKDPKESADPEADWGIRPIMVNAKMAPYGRRLSLGLVISFI